MSFWSEQYGDRIYTLDYEALVTDQEVETRRLADYVGLDWEEALLSPQKNKRAVQTVSQQQVRKGVYQGSSQQWRKFEPYLGGVFDELGRNHAGHDLEFNPAHSTCPIYLQVRMNMTRPNPVVHCGQGFRAYPYLRRCH